MVINADALGHETYKPGGETWRRVVDAFGEEVVGPGGEIDRRRLGRVVFADPAARAKLNAITWPEITRLARSRIQGLRRQEAGTIVLEAALLIEAGWDSLVDEVWITRSPREKVVDRLKDRDGLPEEEISRRISSQLSFEERLAGGGVVVDNAAGLEELDATVRNLWETLKKDAPNENG